MAASGERKWQESQRNPLSAWRTDCRVGCHDCSLTFKGCFGIQLIEHFSWDKFASLMGTDPSPINAAKKKGWLEMKSKPNERRRRCSNDLLNWLELKTHQCSKRPERFNMSKLNNILYRQSWEISTADVWKRPDDEHKCWEQLRFRGK